MPAMSESSLGSWMGPAQGTTSDVLILRVLCGRRRCHDFGALTFLSLTPFHSDALVAGRALQTPCSGLSGNLAISHVPLPNTSDTVAVYSQAPRVVRVAYHASRVSHRI
eukprot:499080-Pyramimonas_sp.AAC.1